MQETQKVVLALDFHDDKKCKKKVMKIASSVYGIDSISLDTENKKLTLIGIMDAVEVVGKLRKTYRTDVVTIGLAKEPEKKPKPEPEVIPFSRDCASYNPFYPYCYIYHKY